MLYLTRRYEQLKLIPNVEFSKGIQINVVVQQIWNYKYLKWKNRQFYQEKFQVIMEYV